MGRIYIEYCSNNSDDHAATPTTAAPAEDDRIHEHHYTCRECGVDLVLCRNMISDEYRSGRHKGQLYPSVLNIELGETYEKDLISGRHSIAAVFCVSCQTELGWKYISAESSANKHKEGKIILVEPMLRKRERTISHSHSQSHTIPPPPALTSTPSTLSHARPSGTGSHRSVSSNEEPHGELEGVPSS